MMGIVLGLGLYGNQVFNGAAVAINFRDMLTGDVPSGFTFTRSTAGTYWDANGVLQSAAINAMRISRDPVSGELGYLAEPQRTNLLLYSILPGGTTPATGWTNTLTTGTVTLATSIYGSADGAAAYTFATSAQRMVWQQSVTTANNTTYAYSVMVEAVSGTITNQDVVTVTSIPSGASITGYYVNGVASTSSTQAVVGKLTLILGGTYTGASTVFRIGNGCFTGNTTASVTLSRPQLEAGSYPTSYMPTTTGTVSRGADLLTHTLSGANATALSTAGTMVVRATLFGESPSAASSAERYFACVDDGTSANRISLGTSTSATVPVKGLLRQASSLDGNTGPTETLTTNTPFKAAMYWGANHFNVALKGTIATEDVTCPTMPAVTRLGIGESSFGANLLGGLIHSVSVYTSRLTDAQLQALTA